MRLIGILLTSPTKPPTLPPLLIVVYAYKLSHIIGRDVTSRTGIKLVNEQKGYFRLQEIPGSSPLTRYNIIIDSPSRLGFRGGERPAVFDRIHDLLLAMNLELNQVVISPDSLIPLEYRWLGNEGGIRENSNAILGMGQPEQLDGVAVKTNLKRIDKLGWHKERKRINQPKYRRKANLIKALSIYESALYAIGGRQGTDKVSRFRTLLTVIEIASNWHTPLSNQQRDRLLKKLAGIHIKRAAKWRGLYNRTKHVDETIKQHKDYRKMRHLPLQEIISCRLAANTILLDRLCKL
jgi:hypothetical protein